MKHTLRYIASGGIALLVGALAVATETSDLSKIEAALNQGQLEQAEKLLSKALATNSEHAEVHSLNGKLLMRKKAYKEAVESFEKAVKSDGKKALYHSSLANAKIMVAQQGNPMLTFPLYGQAKESYQKALELDPQHIPAHQGLARYYSNAPSFAGGSMEKAKEHANAILELDAFKGSIELAFIAKADKDHAASVSYFQKAIEAAPNEQAWLHYQKGDAYRQSGDTENARIAYKEALRINPNHQGAQKALGVVTSEQ